MSILLNVVHSSWKLVEWIARLMKTGNCSISSLTVASLLKWGLQDDRRPSTQHFLVDLVELDRWVYPHPCWHSTFHTPQGWWYKYVPLETSNFVDIWYIISHCYNASFSKTPGHFLANLLCAVLATCSCALFSRFVRAFCLYALLATCSCGLRHRGSASIVLMIWCSMCHMIQGFLYCLSSTLCTW